MSLPNDREELCQRWDAGERFHFLFFYGHHAPETGVDASCFSQWFARPFEVEGLLYPTAEHWMMAEKARLFEDPEMLEAILSATTPREAKACGRKVQHFDPATWDDHKFEIVRRGNLEKFSQHEDLKNYLLATSNYQPDLQESTLETESDVVREQRLPYKAARSELTHQGVILVEAAGRDVIWGIGLGSNNPMAQDPRNWRGSNLLGFALTSVRDHLAATG